MTEKLTNLEIIMAVAGLLLIIGLASGAIPPPEKLAIKIVRAGQ